MPASSLLPRTTPMELWEQNYTAEQVKLSHSTNIVFAAFRWLPSGHQVINHDRGISSPAGELHDNRKFILSVPNFLQGPTDSWESFRWQCGVINPWTTNCQNLLQVQKDYSYQYININIILVLPSLNNPQSQIAVAMEHLQQAPPVYTLHVNSY